MAFNFPNRIWMLTFLLIGGVCSSIAQTDMSADGIPPEGPRDFSSFAKLLMKSPFVMPTGGGDQSPISQRYSLTGAAKIGDKPHVFLLDVVNQTRLMVAPDQPDGDVYFVSLEGGADPSSIRATIRVGEETGVVTFAKSQLAPPPASATPENGQPANNPVPALTSATPPPANVPPTAGGTRPPTAAELEQLGTAAQAGNLQPVAPRRILRRTNTVPLPANGQPAPTQ